MSRGEAEKSRTLAEARAVESRQERDVTLAEKARLSEDLQHLSKEVYKPGGECDFTLLKDICILYIIIQTLSRM